MGAPLTDGNTSGVAEAKGDQLEPQWSPPVTGGNTVHAQRTLPTPCAYYPPQWSSHVIDGNIRSNGLRTVTQFSSHNGASP